MTMTGRNAYGNAQYQCDFCKGDGVVPLDDDKHHSCMPCLRACAQYVLDCRVPETCITVRVDERKHRAAIQRHHTAREAAERAEREAFTARNGHLWGARPQPVATENLTSDLTPASQSANMTPNEPTPPTTVGGVPIIRTKE